MTESTHAAAGALRVLRYCWRVPFLLLHVLVLIRSLGDTGRIFTAVSSTEGAFLRYGTLLEIIERLDINNPDLCLRLFKSNRDAGLILFAALIGDALYQNYSV